MLRAIAFSLLALSGPTAAAQPARLTGGAFGEEVVLELRDLAPEAAEAALRAALAEIGAVERLAALTSPPGGPGGVADLNAGAGARAVDPRLLALLARARDFCLWSERAYGPLAGRLHAAWGLHVPPAGLPGSEALREAAASADCGRLRLDPQAGTAALEAGSAVDLWGFAAGWAVDRAVETLKERGAKNGLVRVGPVRRAFGPGHDGRGWRVALPRFAGLEEALSPVWLRDRALAVAAPLERRVVIAGDGYSRWIHQRTGRPVDGIVGVVAVTELAADAQGLAATLAVAGPREGKMRLGILRPQPSVLWLLGGGEGEPLLMDHRWALVPKR